MRKEAKKILMLVLGIIFILLGLVGLVFPFLQGILFIIIGLILISIYFPQMRLWMKSRVERVPHLLSLINRVEAWVNKFVENI